MKKILKYFSIIVFTTLLFQQCATNKIVNDPSGDWEFTVSGTPYGSIKGTMNISATGGIWVAKMKAMGDNLEMNPMTFDAKTGKATGSFNFQGNSVMFQAIHQSGSMNGSLSAAGADFPFQAVKAASGK